MIENGTAVNVEGLVGRVVRPSTGAATLRLTLGIDMNIEASPVLIEQTGEIKWFRTDVLPSMILGG
jgi:hypothetical protein